LLVIVVSLEAVSCASNTFVFKHDMFASATGLYRVDGYDVVSPELEMQFGVEYVFDQQDATNWYHPLGFAYYPDGAHEGKDEVETEELEYIINGELRDLDTYEPQFFFPRDAWMDNKYQVNLTITDPNVKEIFYFCHIHNKMSGRIKIVGGNDLSAVQDKELYEPPVASAFDAMCGTSDTAAFRDKATYCPGTRFLCGDTESEFVQCMEAIDCKMNYEMRINNFEADPVVTFMHQMIPHHANAVNMAKILLKQEATHTLDEDTKNMLLDIVNGQNAQMTFMRGWLVDKNYSVEMGAAACTTTSDANLALTANNTSSQTDLKSEVPKCTSAAVHDACTLATTLKMTLVVIVFVAYLL